MTEVFVRWTVGDVENELLFDSEVGPPPGILPRWPVPIEDATASLASSAAGQREGWGKAAERLWTEACVGREGYCSSDLQDAARSAIVSAFALAERVARGVDLPANYQWSDSNREKFHFGRDTAADAIAMLAASPSAPEERRNEVRHVADAVHEELWKADYELRRLRAAIRDIAEAEAIPNDAVAFVWCRDVARAALNTVSHGGEHG